MKVIVNADDFGASIQVNQAIENCIRHGEITSTTIMAGGKAFLDAVEIARRYPQISFGVHLTLDEFDSLTHSPVFAKFGITDSDGRFVKGAYKKIDNYPSELKKAIEEEWNAQIEKVREAGIDVSHVDSHHHCHTVPQLSSVLIKVLQKNKICRIRLRHLKTVDMYIRHMSDAKKQRIECSSSQIGNKSFFKIIYGLIRGHLWQMNIKRRFLTSDFFCSYSFYHKNRDYFERTKNDWVVELMCHPGHPDYEIETNNLKLLPTSVVKINYNDLK